MLLIFDWDGTLSDSTGKITQVMQQSARDLGWRVPEDHQVHNIIGLGLPEALTELFPEHGPEAWGALRERYAHNFVTEDTARPSAFFPGVMETLTRLRDDGYTLAVATGKSRRGLDRILTQLDLDGFFHETRCADETASKPQPQMLEELLAHFGRPAGEAVMVGDTEYDMDMARRVAMPRIAVSYGAHHIDRLRPYEPALCMDVFAELAAWERLAGSGS
ncbi:HAD-IIIA family hydrolase [Marinimicrobium alkaliphilum]|uniref:HAD-IIIA family hydrolase n=1 Tax=Marinimicrobium alkaliphilum TaxID=2202654 RepID=UPI000DB8FDD2|nr:HAD-IIIA family hydrolase [Marinimicrobium alkaliphilum]